MGERESYTHGTFSWTDLGTSDAEAAKSFYSGLFDWELEDNPMPGGGHYTMAGLGGRHVAGLYTAQEGFPPAWLSYVTVDDVDAAAGRVAELGGTVISEPFDVMESGRMALLSDPTGATFAIWEARDHIGAGLVNGHGALSLNQLNTDDPERAGRFYADLFGWRTQAVPDTEIPYWGISVGERINAGMMQLPPGSPAPPHWLVYFGSEDIDGAAEKIAASGGTIVVPKSPVPGGEILVAQDPQGAMFALFAGRFDD